MAKYLKFIILVVILSTISLSSYLYVNKHQNKGSSTNDGVNQEEVKESNTIETTQETVLEPVNDNAKEIVETNTDDMISNSNSVTYPLKDVEDYPTLSQTEIDKYIELRTKMRKDNGLETTDKDVENMLRIYSYERKIARFKAYEELNEIENITLINYEEQDKLFRELILKSWEETMEKVKENK